MSRRSYIEKLILDLRFPLISDGREALSQARTRYEKKILPEIEKIANRYAETTVRIDHLKLDLGVLNSSELAEKFAAMFEAAIVRALQQSTVSNNEDKSTLKPDNYTENHIFESFIFYLKYGYTSPFSGESNSAIPVDWVKKVLDSSDDRSIAVIYELIAGDQFPSWNREQALFRFLQLIAAGDKMKFLEMFSQRLPGNLKNLLENIIHQVKSLNHAFPLHKGFQDNVIERLFYMVTIRKEVSKLAEISTMLNKLEVLIQAKYLSENPVRGKRKGWQKEQSEPIVKGVSGKELSRLKAELVDLAGEIQPYPGKSAAVDLFSEKERFLIGNAGLVLIAPFLPRFFENAGLIRDKTFISDRHRMHAAFLIQKMVEPSRKFYENILVLNKLLCGIPLSATVDIKQKLTKNEKQEIIDLLDSVIANWTALKNTTTGGFREAFLQRKGSVEKNGDDYCIRVDVLSHDILLSYLPWNITLIKYPWNDYLIHVEWNQP